MKSQGLPLGSIQKKKKKVKKGRRKRKSRGALSDIRSFGGTCGEEPLTPRMTGKNVSSTRSRREAEGLAACITVVEGRRGFEQMKKKKRMDPEYGRERGKVPPGFNREESPSEAKRKYF